MATPPPQKPGGFGKFSKTLSFWLIAILVPVVFFQMTNKGGEQATKIDYSLYDAQLTADNISKVTIIGGKLIEGEFKNRILVQGRDTKTFSTQLAIANSEGEVQRLRDKQVAIKAEDPRVSIASGSRSISSPCSCGAFGLPAGRTRTMNSPETVSGKGSAETLQM